MTCHLAQHSIIIINNVENNVDYSISLMYNHRLNLHVCTSCVDYVSNCGLGQLLSSL